MSPRPREHDRLAIILGAVLLMTHQVIAGEALTLERKISLGEVRGRIDHLAIDLPGIASSSPSSATAAWASSISHRRRLRRIMGLAEPQGVAYDPPPTPSGSPTEVTASFIASRARTSTLDSKQSARTPTMFGSMRRTRFWWAIPALSP